MPKRSRSRSASYAPKMKAPRLTATQVARVVSAAARASGAVETHYVDGYKDNTTIHAVGGNDDTWADCELNPQDQTGTYGCLPMPSPGDLNSSRTGRKIHVKWIDIRGTVLFGPANAITAATSYGYARLVLVQDTRTQQSSGEISAEEVIGPGVGSDGQASLSADAAINLPTNPNGWGRFRILADKYIRANGYPAVHDGTDGAILGVRVPFHIRVKVNQPVNFDGATGKIGSIVDNSFHLIGAATASPDTITITYVARTAFLP